MRLGNISVRSFLSYLSLAPDARLWIVLFCVDLCLVSVVVLTPGTPEPEVTDLAVDVVVRTLDAVEVVELAATLDAGKTLLVVEATLGVHLLGLEYLK